MPRRLDFGGAPDAVHKPLPVHDGTLKSRARVLGLRLAQSPALALVVVLPTLVLLVELFGAISSPPVSVADFDSCSTEACEMRVPKIIHQTYKTKTLPPDWEDTPKLWQEQHPGWQYEFWDDERNRAFIAEHYPWFLAQFDAYPNGIQRADAIRYFILYHYGGVYADMDIQPRRNIAPLLGDAEVVLPLTPNVGLTNAFMASAPRSDFMRHVTEQLIPYANRWYHVTRHWQIITSTGPTFIWKVANSYGGPSRILRVPASVWGKCVICASSCEDVPDAYFHHLHGDSWHNFDSWFFTYVLFCHKYTATALGVALIAALLLRQNIKPWALLNRDLLLYSAVCFLILMLFFQG
jgi:inositol phosphorylceramide mannosyltransferase catalytic subunit